MSQWKEWRKTHFKQRRNTFYKIQIVIKLNATTNFQKIFQDVFQKLNWWEKFEFLAHLIAKI